MPAVIFWNMLQNKLLGIKNTVFELSQKPNSGASMRKWYTIMQHSAIPRIASIYQMRCVFFADMRLVYDSSVFGGSGRHAAPT